MGTFAAIVNDDVRQTLTGAFQVRMRSLEFSKYFLMGVVVTDLARNAGDSLILDLDRQTQCTFFGLRGGVRLPAIPFLLIFCDGI